MQHGLKIFLMNWQGKLSGGCVHCCSMTEGVELAQDVYSEVARVVEGFVERDAARGLPEAIALQGMVDRKLVKQSVMTSVYGVTTLGARDQVAARLRERGWPNNHHLRKIAMYGAKVRCQASAAAPLPLGSGHRLDHATATVCTTLRPVYCSLRLAFT